MKERIYPDDSIKGVAMEILSESILEYRFDIWDIIGQDVIDDVKTNTGVGNGCGFYSIDVKDAIGRALQKHLNMEHKYEF